MQAELRQTGAPFSCVAIVGVGLIGGSLGMALRKRGLAGRVLGIDLNEEVIREAALLGAIDDGSKELAAIAAADLVVFATPVGRMAELIARAAQFVKPEALVTDVGSVKTAIVAAGELHFGCRFVGGHPMAGSEASGVSAAKQDLFNGAAWALTPSRMPQDIEDIAVYRIHALIAAMGARPVYLDPEEHDRMVALVSHLPHALSFAYSQTIASDSAGTKAKTIAGPSYDDMTRVSHSSLSLWADIFVENRTELVRAIVAFEATAARLREVIETGDRTAILQGLQDGRSVTGRP